MQFNKKVWIGIAVVVVLFVVGLWTSRGGTPVETVQVNKGTITRNVEDTGYVQSANSYDLYATQNGRVIKRPVETGQMVKKGQTLLVIENLDLVQQADAARSALPQARSNVDSARAALKKSELDLQNSQQNLDRSKQLFNQGALSQTDYKQAVLQYESYKEVRGQLSAQLASAVAAADGAARNLAQLNAKVAALEVKSPVEGELLSLPVDKEEYVMPGAQLASVATPGLLEIKADILSDDLAEVQLGQKVLVTSPVLGEKEITGKVKKIYPRAEEKQSALGIIQRRVPVIITISDAANLRPGFEVRVAIQTQQRSGVLILPRESVRTSTDGSKEVLLVVNNQVSHKTIQTGLGDNDNLEILNGLNLSNTVVKDASLDLADKTRIKPI